jgi:hypothetical protein
MVILSVAMMVLELVGSRSYPLQFTTIVGCNGLVVRGSCQGCFWYPSCVPESSWVNKLVLVKESAPELSYIIGKQDLG